MQIYLINLKSSVERRQRMETLLNSLKLQFEIVEAVRGGDLTNVDLIEQFEYKDTMQLGANEFGCLLSHLKCWKSFLATEHETALICEDDIHFSPNFLTCIATLKIPLNELCLVRLETFLATVTVVRRPIQQEASYGVYTLLTSHGGTGVYAINRITAQYLIGIYRKMKSAIDIELFAPDRRSIPAFTVYQVIPAPCVQDEILFGSAGNGFLRSMIGNDRADVRLGIKPSPRQNAAKAIKNLLRPIYRLLFSSFLSLRGKRRVKVRYG